MSLSPSVPSVELVTAAGEIARHLSGRITTPADPDWDSQRAAWNLVVDQRPELVGRPATAADVAAIVDFAGRHGLRVASQEPGTAPARWVTLPGPSCCTPTACGPSRSMSIDVGSGAVLGAGAAPVCHGHPSWPCPGPWVRRPPVHHTDRRLPPGGFGSSYLVAPCCSGCRPAGPDAVRPSAHRRVTGRERGSVRPDSVMEARSRGPKSDATDVRGALRYGPQ